MNEILRKRLLRKLEVLPEPQLYQVLDYIEFLESKYAPGRAAQPLGIQRFAERVEDRLRARSVLPELMSGTMRVFGTAGRVLEGIGEAGRGLIEGVESGLAPGQPGVRSTASRPSSEPSVEPADPGPDSGEPGSARGA